MGLERNIKSWEYNIRFGDYTMTLPKKQTDQTILGVVAIVAILILTLAWIATGHNSYSYTLAVASILTIAGYGVGFIRGRAGL